MNKVLYPGSFDPITKGHMNIIEQASELFDEVVIAVMQNSTKKGLFTINERVEIITELYKNSQNIKIVTSSGATVDLANLCDCKAMIRGLRGVSDFDEEIQLASINKKISNPKVNTVCLFADEPYKYISSSMVKEVFSLGKDITDYVHPLVKNKLEQKLAQLNNKN